MSSGPSLGLGGIEEKVGVGFSLLSNLSTIERRQFSRKFLN